MASPRLMGLLAMSLLEATSEEKETKTLLKELAVIASQPERKDRYLLQVETEAIRLSAKRTPEERYQDARRARGLAERLLHRAALGFDVAAVVQSGMKGGVP